MRKVFLILMSICFFYANAVPSWLRIGCADVVGGMTGAGLGPVGVGVGAVCGSIAVAKIAPPAGSEPHVSLLDKSYNYIGIEHNVSLENNKHLIGQPLEFIIDNYKSKLNSEVLSNFKKFFVANFPNDIDADIIKKSVSIIKNESAKSAINSFVDQVYVDEISFEEFKNQVVVLEKKVMNQKLSDNDKLLTYSFISIMLHSCNYWQSKM